MFDVMLLTFAIEIKYHAEFKSRLAHQKETAISEKELLYEQTLEKAKQYQAQMKRLKQQQKAEERKRRTHLLCCAGGELANIFGHVLEKDEIRNLGNFLRRKIMLGEIPLVGIEQIEMSEAESEREELKTDIFSLDDMFNL